MKYRRMPIEIESPEQVGYANIRCNLTESSVTDLRLGDLNLDLNTLTLAYTDHLGAPVLRALLASEGEGLTPEDIILTAGAAAALFIVATSLLDARSRLVVMRPNYATNIETPRALGCAIDFLDLTFEDGYRFDIQRLAALVQPGTRLISLTTPHNPTGMVLTAADLHAVIALAERHDCYVLVDETYREMNFAGPTPVAASLSPRCISVSSLSKSYGVPGIRIGWITTRDPVLQERFLAAKEQIFICNSIVDESIAERVVAQKATLLPAILQRNAQAFATVKAWIASEPLMEWVEPAGGVVCLPRIRADVAVDVPSFYRILNASYKTFVGPGHWFEQDRRSMRIGYGWPQPLELAEGLENISRAVRESQLSMNT